MMAHSPSRFSRRTILAILAFATFLLIGMGLVAGTVYMWTSQTRGIADAFRPRVDSKEVLSGAIQQLRGEGKLVVLSADVAAEATSSTRKKIFFGLVDLGETVVQVRAPARVQYVVSLDELTQDDFTFDAERRRLVLAVPNPRLDTSIVQVSTDPSEIDVYSRIGWLRLDALSGTFNENRARTRLRDAAIHAGQSGYWLSEAQDSAREELHRLLTPLLDFLKEDVTLIIAFHDEPRPSVEADTLPRPRSPASF
jgi:hypothetical protein